MVGITLTETKTHLATWLDADKAVAKGQSFSINGKTKTLLFVHSYSLSIESQRFHNDLMQVTHGYLI